MGRWEAIERKEEPGHACGHGAHEKKRCPTVESFRRQQPEHDNESREDSDQAQHNVDDRKCRHTENHDAYLPFLRDYIGPLGAHEVHKSVKFPARDMSNRKRNETVDQGRLTRMQSRKIGVHRRASAVPSFWAVMRLARY